jgi:hypothetical protein
MAYALNGGPIGNQQLTPWNLPDTTARQLPGTIVNAVDPYWGGGEFIYLKANGTITQYALVTILPVVTANQVVYNATEVPNTANLGRSLAVAMTPATTGQFFWACIGGVVPVDCQASVAADTTFGIAAAGQGGANSAGKQILNARVAIAAAATVAKAGCTSTSGSTRLNIPNADGWFIGIYLSGTGIAALTVVTDIDPSGTIATISVATTAAVAGTVTGTYNNATVFYNVAHINRPFAQGAIT